MTNAQMLSMTNNVLAYNLLTLCSQNADGTYCTPLSDQMGPNTTCADLTAAGCCAGLLVNTALDCNDPSTEMGDVLNAWKTTCTQVDFTQTCGLPKSSTCCAPGAAICGTKGGAAFGVAPAIFTLAALLVKFLF